MYVLRQLMITPFGLLLALVYSLALVTLVCQQDWRGLAFVGGTFLLTLLLIPLLLRLANREDVHSPSISRPWSGLSLWVLLLIVQLYLESITPRWIIGGYEINSVLVKLLLLFVLPLLFLRLQGVSMDSLGFKLDYWRADLKLILTLGFIVLISVLGLIFLLESSSATANRFHLNAPKTVLAFIYFVFRSGLPEEFFFRVYLQEHLNAVLKSRWDGLALAALVFGLLHILHWKLKGASFLTAFAYAALGQMSVGLLFCLLWERVRSLMPLALIHGWLNAVAISSGLARAPLG